MRSTAPVWEFLARFFDLDVANYSALIALNARGVFPSIQAEISAMLAIGSCVIVNVASTTGLIGATNLAQYTARKHPVVDPPLSVALEFAKQNVRVNVVAPSYYQHVYSGQDRRSRPQHHQDDGCRWVVWRSRMRSRWISPRPDASQI